MFLRPRSALLTALALTFAVLPACKSSAPKQPPQAQTAGLRIDVQKADFSQRKQRIDVRVRVWNDHDDRVNFELGNVRLLFNGREVSPNPTMTKDPNPDVQAKSNRTFDWAFEVGDVIGEGNYPIEIRDLKKGGLSLGEVAQFKINLGG
ncbi:MAG: hypothetical protein JNK15_00365 [Planctomycetes bacterium]|nr:hypothetical protein [Planctomycetota bacterium]